jgi:hypothetical protein
MKWEEARQLKVNKRVFFFSYCLGIVHKNYRIQIDKLLDRKEREKKKTERDLQRTKEGQTETGGSKTDKQTLGERKV